MLPLASSCYKNNTNKQKLKTLELTTTGLQIIYRLFVANLPAFYVPG